MTKTVPYWQIPYPEGPREDFYETNKWTKEEEILLWEALEGCKHVIQSGPGGGIVCNKCRGWFCY
jgi:hypothetical protein